MSEWCQNKKCPQKKTQGQIRGSKGAKYYQSNKANTYIGYWCSNGCRDSWWSEHKDTCMQAVGFIDKQVLPLEDAWYVEFTYNWREEIGNRYHLINKLKGKHNESFNSSNTFVFCIYFISDCIVLYTTSTIMFK